MSGSGERRNDAPTVSVLMSVYNGERYLKDAVDSILNQTLRDFAFLIVDDGSTDRSVEILQDYAARDRRIRLLTSPHRGLPSALNHGLRHVRSPLVARMDADDVALPHRLQRQVQAMAERPGLAVLGSAVDLIDSHGMRIRTRPALQGTARVRQTLELRNCICHPSVIMRTEALKRLGGYREQYLHSQDYDLWLRMVEQFDVDNLPEILLRYRKHDARHSDRRSASRHTIYSVSAAVDYFSRKILGGDGNGPIDILDHDGLAERLARLYLAATAADDRSRLNRHALRFLRHSRALSVSARACLVKALSRHLTIPGRIKLGFYDLLARVQR